MSQERGSCGRFVKVDSTEDAFRGLLMQRKSGTLLVDIDGTLKTASAGLVPFSRMLSLYSLAERGWEIRGVTNQSIKGHVVARCLGNLLDCPSYPDCFLDRGWPVFGGGWDFLWNHYKEGERSVAEVSENIINSRKLGTLVMMGDEESDVVFFNNLVGELKRHGCQRESLFLKIPFLGIPRMDRPVLRRLQAVLP